MLLKRRKFSGFVPYPKHWEKRIIGGRATFQTKCDMLVGPCACGYIHRETDDWVQAYLEEYNDKIEPFILKEQDGGILLPKYWPPIHFNNKRCSHLIGNCRCGKVHKKNDDRTKHLLNKYTAKIQ